MHRHIYIYMFLLPVSESIFQNFKVLCFLTCGPTFFWQVRTNGNQVLCFLFQGLWFKVIVWRPCTDIYIYMHRHIYIYIYVFIARFRKITFFNFSKCCVFDIWTHTFSDRYELMETRCCVYCFWVYGLRFLLEGHAHIYIYIYIYVFLLPVSENIFV